MKKLIIISFFIVLSTNHLFAQSPRVDRAKIVIRQHFKETMNDYNSYEPISYGSIDSLYTDIRDNDLFQFAADGLIKAKGKIPDHDNLSYSFDVTPLIKYLDEELSKESNPSVALKILDLKANYVDFQVWQQRVQVAFDSFAPEFIGWKMTHKYRAKNQYNATILYNQVFHFDKELKKVTSINDVDE